MRIIRRGVALEPRDHCRTSRERLPASVKATGALWPRRIDDLMPDLGMRPVHSAVKLTVENDPATNPRSHRNVDQALAISSRAPARLGQSSGVTVVLQR